jgi:capsular polysaccharide biosynthesis protein
MIQEPLDLRKALRLVRRHKFIVWTAAVIGIVAGVGYAMLRPPTLTAEAWVVIAPSPRGVVTGTQVLIAGSDRVLTDALADIHPEMSLPELRDKIQVTDETPTIIGISAEGQTATQAEVAANAVAQSYVDYVGHPENLPDGPVQARVLQAATTATGTSRSSHLAGMSLLGGLLGGVLAGFIVLGVGHRDRRLRERDEIADSIGVPVLASMGVEHPSDAADWTRLIEHYEPGAVDAWRMRKALQYLGFADLALDDHRSGGGFSLTVVSFSFDPRALALAPQLAAFAASRGIPTALVVGPQQNVHATATLRAACSALALATSGPLQVIVRDDDGAIQPSDATLTVVVAVVDGQAPQILTYEAPSWNDLVSNTMRTTATVLGVSAGVATAEQLARVAASAAVAGHSITGILVADPDPSDPTTGRLPQVSRPARPGRPTRMTGTAMETRR